jgi:septum formation topological specificity factor MinE
LFFIIFFKKPKNSVEDLRARLQDLDIKHRRLLEEHASALRQLKQQVRETNREQKSFQTFIFFFF